MTLPECGTAFDPHHPMDATSGDSSWPFCRVPLSSGAQGQPPSPPCLQMQVNWPSGTLLLHSSPCTTLVTCNPESAQVTRTTPPPPSEQPRISVSCHLDSNPSQKSSPSPPLFQISVDLQQPPTVLQRITETPVSHPPPSSIPLRPKKLHIPTKEALKMKSSSASNSPDCASKAASQYPFTLVPRLALNASKSFNFPSVADTESLPFGPAPPVPPRRALSQRDSDPTSLSTFDVVDLQGHERQLSICGFFYGRLTWREAERMLQGTPEGTFLLRESENPCFMYSLSVQTRRGPTSVRIVYDCGGKYRLDADRPSTSLPCFTSPLALIDHYIERSSKPGPPPATKHRALVWKDPSGETFSPILLSSPLRKDPPSLLHLARLSLNRNKKVVMRRKTETLPPRVKAQLIDYPYLN